MKPYPDFKLAVRERESSNDYACVNSIGFLGAYQFGRPRLTDLGICVRDNFNYVFKSPYTQAGFLGSPVLQDAVFDLHAVNLKLRIVKLFPLMPIESVSGAVMVAHLLGLGGLIDLESHGIDGADAFGTKASDYRDLFKGYDIP